MEVASSHRRIAVAEASQPMAARFAARECADAVGFGEEDAYRTGLVATELATNLVKHATGGEILVAGIRGGASQEVEIIAIDRGPGMSNISHSLADGVSTTGTSGTGLGAVWRLADDCDVYTHTGGTVIAARLRAKRAKAGAEALVEIGGISVAKDGESVCGDAWHAHHHSDGTLLAVVDGLGHGLSAWEASSGAIAAVDVRKKQDVVSVLEQMHGAIRHTRGAAGAVADMLPRAQLVKFAGIGNISGTIAGPTTVRHTVSLNGTLGHEARQFREYSYPWDADSTVVFHSDGLTSHWSLDGYRGLRARRPLVVAAVLYRDFSRQRDDVTVVVGRVRS